MSGDPFGTGVTSSAILSEYGTDRYRLERTWEPSLARGVHNVERARVTAAGTAAEAEAHVELTV